MDLENSKFSMEMAAVMGYSDINNPFGDTNLYKEFVWKKKLKQKRSHGTRDLKIREQLMEIKKQKDFKFELKRKRQEEQIKERIKRENSSWSFEEDDFVLQQNRVKARIRIKEGRHEPIDLLICLFLLDNEDICKEIYHLIPPEILKEPFSIIDQLNDSEIQELKKEARTASGFNKQNARFWNELVVLCDLELEDRRLTAYNNVHSGAVAVSNDIKALFESKNPVQLDELHEQISLKIQEDIAIDVDYWEDVLKELTCFRAKEWIKKIVSERLANFSPPSRPDSNSETLENGEKYENEDEDFDAEVETKTHYPWQDQFVAKKPKYLNHVQKGYHWSHYNKVHYNKNNPPPKFVQGYKFNIFYPDLVNPEISPHWKLLEGDNKDHQIIRFIGGAPYEDVCFRIVKGEWDRSYKKGFKSEWDGKVLKLWFRFKKYQS